LEQKGKENIVGKEGTTPTTGSERVCGALRAGIAGAVLTVIGIILSGPAALLVVNLVHGQPAWQGARTFVGNFHPVQTAPFFGGIALVVGYVVLMPALYHIAGEGQKTRALIATVLSGVFATLIFFNYINQTTFVPALARNYRPEYEGLISAFSFSNPNSLCWAIEMWGYAFLGLATWLAAPVFNGTGMERTARMLMMANGVFSIAGALVVSYELTWVFTPAGFLSYAAWNLLVLVLSICIISVLRRRQRQVEAT
jgi:hypothetical protein